LKEVARLLLRILKVKLDLIVGGIQMSQEDILIEELIDANIDGILEDDAYYNLQATPIKPASAVKAEHRKQLKAFFMLTELREQLNEAQELILKWLPSLISQEEFAKVKSEFDGASEHFFHYVEAMSEEDKEKTVLLQEMFGLSNETLLHAYALGSKFFKEGKTMEAWAIFVFLTTMTPYVASYWIAQGICLTNMNRQEEALTLFNTAKFLNPTDPVPVAHMCECYVALKDRDGAKRELATLKTIVTSLGGDEKRTWEEKIRNFKV
jgi:tetratricopeptide (TPR) repeat protein